MLCLCGLVAASVGALQAGSVVDAGHDSGVTRVLGLAAQPWRALDVAVGGLLTPVPAGTRVARAEVGGALVVGLAAAALYALTRRLLSHCARAPRLGPVVAAIATLSALLGPAWQREGVTIGGSATGASLILLAPLLALRALERPTRGRWSAVAAVLGLSIGHEPLVGLSALGAIAVLAACCRQFRVAFARRPPEELRTIAAGGALGLLPFIVAVARTRASGAPLAPALLRDWAGERGAAWGGSLAHLASENIGGLGATMALAGLTAGLLAEAARPLVLALGAMTLIGVASPCAGAPVGPTRVGAPVLAATAAAWAFAGVGLLLLVRLVDQARVPLARWAAAMVILLELTLAVEAADASFAAPRPRTDEWDALVWGKMPPGTVVLLADPRTYERAQAARASGTLPDRITIVPTFQSGGPPSRALLTEASWRHLWRDLALDGKPSEASLAALADSSPLDMAYDLEWDHGLARHLVPDGLFDRYTAEPRGAIDRLRALDAFRAVRDELALVVGHDPDLAEVTGACLRARIAGYAAAGERDLALRGAADALAITPSDPAVAKLVDGMHGIGGAAERARAR
jgi:hypothetical protein